MKITIKKICDQFLWLKE